MIRTLLSGLLAVTSGIAWAGISPSQLEVNLGPVPLDLYSNSNNGWIPSCSGYPATTAPGLCSSAIGACSRATRRRVLQVSDSCSALAVALSPAPLLFCKAPVPAA